MFIFMQLLPLRECVWVKDHTEKIDFQSKCLFLLSSTGQIGYAVLYILSTLLSLCRYLHSSCHLVIGCCFKVSINGLKFGLIGHIRKSTCRCPEHRQFSIPRCPGHQHFAFHRCPGHRRFFPWWMCCDSPVSWTPVFHISPVFGTPAIHNSPVSRTPRYRFKTSITHTKFCSNIK